MMLEDDDDKVNIAIIVIFKFAYIYQKENYYFPCYRVHHLRIDRVYLSECSVKLNNKNVKREYGILLAF